MMLDDILSAAPATAVTPPLVSAAPGVPDTTAPPAFMPPPPHLPMVAATGDPTASPLEQAKTAQAQAMDTVLASPLAVQTQDAMDQDNAAKDAAATAMEANNAKAQALVDEPIPDRPPLPEFQPYAAPPTAHPSNPMKVFATMLPMMAALGAIGTRNAGINALNAGAAMLDAIHKNDLATADKERQTWLDQTNQVVRSNDQLMQDYKLVLDDRNLSMQDKTAKLSSIAALNKDVLGAAALRSGHMKSFTDRNNMLTTASDKVMQMTTDIGKADADQAAKQSEQMQQWARLSIDWRKAQNMPMGDVVGTILQKVATANLQPGQSWKTVLSPSEIQAISLYVNSINARLPLPGAPGANPGGQPNLNVLPGEDPGAAGAGGATPPPPPTRPAAPPVALPVDPAQRVVGKVYASPAKGPVVWDGKNLRQVVAPPGG